MRTLANPQTGQPLATVATVESSGAVGRLILKPRSATPPQPAPQVLLPAWELRGVIIDKVA